LLTTVFWATLWGPAGLILSTPLTVCLVVLGRHVPHLFFLHILLGDEPALAAEAHLYQRLLAMDDQEACAVAEEYLRENSLLQLYDLVILPTLTLAEQDRHKGDLDPEREEFVFLNLREMLAEFSENAQNAAGESPEERPEQTNPGRILCFPAHDEADEIAAAMLAQLLEQAGRATISFPLGSSSENMLGIVEPSANDIFCISAVPPFAFSHARTLNRQLRTKFPHSKFLIGVWGFNGDFERAVQRFKPWPPDKFVSNLVDAIAYLHPPAPVLNPEASNPEVAEGPALMQP